ncbi:DUF1440 domain-containing protein [Geomesophilobacter sediminis]|uniref:DUF1440 domain-containing protein n=1 Tax=Geomesophilobacter sediminis TaxID=2798584 RepID=A0A8J7LVG7_9BACT|nr:DUF1440 domain-containing protein [Geomesophilobacter sediminis]MBJ6725005.1 DUF1440 domain-containing protein [Geomesophilobacter sediminis]
MARYGSKTSFASRHPLLLGMAAGLFAGAVSGLSDRLLDRMVSREQKARDRLVRRAPAHQLAGPYFARKITGRQLLSKRQRKAARLAFSVVYGIGWGMIYGVLRRKVPVISRLAGLRFGLPFFLACDGTIAPLLKLSPGLRRIPWQMNAKELGNHMAWSTAAELVHRAVGKKE